MNLRLPAIIGMIAFALASCGEQKAPVAAATAVSPLTGTWKLAYSTLIKDGDTSSTYPVPGHPDEMIKIFNGSHFSFFKHDLQKGHDSTAEFSAGAGTYTLAGDKYEEHLQYCNARGWEDKHFSFTVTLQHDTLIQRGIEKIDSLKVNHEIIEAYTRLR
jgi:hypothetical protein